MVSLSSPPQTHTKHATRLRTKLRALTPLIPLPTRLQHETESPGLELDPSERI